MKNVVNTEKTAIRIPSELVDKIDYLVVNTQEYANRPDFIISAVKYTVEWIKDEILINLDRELVYGEGTGIKDIMSDLWEELADSYCSYKGKPVLIFLRVPTGLISVWENIEFHSFEIKNFQDLARLAISKYISYVESSINIDMMLESVSQLKLTDKDKEEFRQVRSTLLDIRGKPLKREGCINDVYDHDT
ncbi:MAG: ribbon-helix-helix domain-containing protein [Prevotella sp.]